MAAHRDGAGVGAVYTDEGVASELWGAILPRLRAGAIVVDPFCGDGGLLLCTEALKAARERGVLLIGYDNDQAAVDAFNQRAQALVLPRRPVARLLDTILSPAPSQVDAVICNPPYLGISKRGEVLGADYQKRIETRYGKGSMSVDLGALAAIAAHRFVIPGGLLAIVATNSLWEGRNHRFSFGPLHADNPRTKRYEEGKMLPYWAKTNVKWKDVRVAVTVNMAAYRVIDEHECCALNLERDLILAA